jgi:hypothetical protein
MSEPAAGHRHEAAPTVHVAHPAVAAPAVRRTATIGYAAPDPALAEFITGYQLYVAGDEAGVEWLLPGVANIRVALGAGPMEVTLGKRRFDPLPTVSFTGPTTHAPRAAVNGGAVVAIGITPLGWGRLSHRSAQDMRDRIVPLADVIGSEPADALLQQLAGLDRVDEEGIKRVLDRWLAPLLRVPGPDEAAVAALAAVLADPAVVAVADAVARSGLEPAVLRRVSIRQFGMLPKLLLRRARFLRSFLGFFQAGGADGYAGIEDSYHDASHFLRDADRFLGTTPRRFLVRSTVLLEASVRARAAALGAATCALHPPEARVSGPAAPPPG